MTQMEPQNTSSVNQVSQAANDGVFSQRTHDRVMENIRPPHQKTTLAAAMEVVVEWFAKIWIQIGGKPSSALQLIDYRNAQIREMLKSKDAANDTVAPEEKKAA